MQAVVAVATALTIRLGIGRAQIENTGDSGHSVAAIAHAVALAIRRRVLLTGRITRCTLRIPLIVLNT